MSKTKKSKTFIKIIYFDEGSATDLLYILGGGKSTDKEEKIVTKTTQLAAGAEAQAGAKINLLTKITAGMGIDGSADASREGRSILSKAIESTVLTDYIRCTENVILLDEFDKPNPVFYSAFYQLFDEGVFADKNYTVTMKNAIIICTSNFLSEEQIRERLGDPIYSRFDAVIHFTDLQPEAVQKLLDREIDRQYSKLDEEERAIIDSRKIVSLLKTNSYCLSNARQIKKFVREAFSATITDEVL